MTLKSGEKCFNLSVECKRVLSASLFINTWSPFTFVPRKFLGGLLFKIKNLNIHLYFIFLVLAGNLKVGTNVMLFLYQTQPFIRSIYYNKCMLLFFKYLFRKFINWEQSD